MFVGCGTAMVDSRGKGAAFERSIINHIKDNLKGEADIIIPKWSIECKAYASGASYKMGWWQQACEAAAGTDMYPVLIYKFNNRPIKCVIQLMAVCRDFTYNPDAVCEVSLPTWFEIVRESYGEG